MMFWKNIFITQYAKAISARILNRLNVSCPDTAKLPTRTLVLCPARSMDCPPANSADRSCEKVFCSDMQNLYSSTGTTPIREQAKKPFRILIDVVLISARPCWYSIATSKMATTIPAMKSDHPNSVKSFMVACTQSRAKISAPMLPIIVKKSATAS